MDERVVLKPLCATEESFVVSSLIIMHNLFAFIASFFLGAAVVWGNQGQPAQPNGQPAIPHEPGHNFGDQKELHDQQHIKEHLQDTVETNKQMSEDEMRYHYFKIHDLNNDNMLDGIELVKAITHHHNDPNVKQEHLPPKLSDTELENIIDNILRDDDYNKDGFIDYAEFLKSQARRATQTPPPPPPAQ